MVATGVPAGLILGLLLIGGASLSLRLTITEVVKLFGDRGKRFLRVA